MTEWQARPRRRWGRETRSPRACVCSRICRSLELGRPDLVLNYARGPDRRNSMLLLFYYYVDGDVVVVVVVAYYYRIARIVDICRGFKNMYINYYHSDVTYYNIIVMHTSEAKGKL